MGKEKVIMISGLPYKSRKTFIEINGLIPLKVFKKLYKRVAFRLPVYQNF